MFFARILKESIKYDNAVLPNQVAAARIRNIFGVRFSLEITSQNPPHRNAAKYSVRTALSSRLPLFRSHPIGDGGTDFRPAFEWVDKLLEQHEFHNLKGLIYFTDGFGIYPKKMPPYKTAFVFMQDNYRDVDVPVWAMKLILDEDDFEKPDR